MKEGEIEFYGDLNNGLNGLYLECPKGGPMVMQSFNAKNNLHNEISYL